MFSFKFDNRFVAELPGDTEERIFSRPVHQVCWSPVKPTPVARPKLIAHSREVAAELGLTSENLADPEFAEVFAGNKLLEGMQPYAACYGGHQFGNWAGQLGDGRAISLGETVDKNGARLELQLKGAGPTPYSRHADGRAVLRSSVREFLCSEAMYHLGVPTTRALSLVGTGEDVVRDMFYNGNPRAEQGAIVCRVAPSFIRFGNFELPAVRKDHALLERLVDFTMKRDYPQLGPPTAESRFKWFEEICVRTARMVVEWMRVGFVHGVMNTDNMSILGLTIDYGPYGWIDNYDPDWTPNTTDAGGRRYRFGAQPEVALWNLSRLGEALSPLFPEPQVLRGGLDRYVEVYNSESQAMMSRKFGIARPREEDEELYLEGLRLMRASEADMTLFFRALAALEAPQASGLEGVFYSPEAFERARPEWTAWLERYFRRLGEESEVSSAERRRKMDAVNPRFVLRNYLAQEAIDLAEQQDYTLIAQLLDVLRRPYDEQPEHARFADKRPDWAKNRAGCSMLSCSS